MNSIVYEKYLYIETKSTIKFLIKGPISLGQGISKNYTNMVLSM